MGSRLSVDDSVRVVIVGGGFGGIAAASQLKSWAVPFVLVDMRDAFHHNVAALRASVESGKPSGAVGVFPHCGSSVRGTDAHSASPTPIRRMTRFWENPRVVRAVLILWAAGKGSNNYLDGPIFFFFLSFFELRSWLR